VSAFRRVFGQVDVTGSWFHFAQAIIKRLNKLGLKDDYMRDASVQDVVRCLMCLPLQPAGEICPAFKEVKLIVTTDTDTTFANSLNRLLRHGRETMDTEAYDWTRAPERAGQATVTEQTSWIYTRSE